MFPKLPQPPRKSPAEHLMRWSREPLELLEEGAALGNPFMLQLWRKTAVGFSPEWNKMVFSDLETFHSKGGLLSLTPYLNDGIIVRDAPQHKPEKNALVGHFHAKAMHTLRDKVRQTIESLLPKGEFEAMDWASKVARTTLNTMMFDGHFPPDLLNRFLTPLKQNFPSSLIPRPWLFHQVVSTGNRLADQGYGVAAHLPKHEIRISLAAGYDTTAHTLAWALWHLATHPQYATPEATPLIIKETLRLFPPGFVNSRIARKPFAFGGIEFPKNTFVFVSVYLTQRHPDYWKSPTQFLPERFRERIPAWGYLPFGGGERLCLGMHFANLVMEEALNCFGQGRLQPIKGDPSPKMLLSIAPKGPLWLRV